MDKKMDIQLIHTTIQVEIIYKPNKNQIMKKQKKLSNIH